MQDFGRPVLTAFVLSALATVAPGPAFAQESAHGFVVRHELDINASPATVYEDLVHGVGSWWDSAHTYSGDSQNLSIDPRPGGCFCEKLPEGGGVEHLRVVHVAPGKLLRMSGALGPLQASGLAGSLTWKLTNIPAGTQVELIYSVGGFTETDLKVLGPAVDAVFGQQLRRLKTFVERRKPVQGSP